MNYLEKVQKLIYGSLANFAAVIAVFYVSGFLSFLCYYRVLGLNNIEGSTQIYAEFAGRCLILIIQTFLVFPFTLFHDQVSFAWGGNALLIWSAITLLLVMLAIFAKKYLTSVIENNKLIKISCFLCLIGITLPIISIESEVISIKNILQPFSISDFAEINNNVLAIQKEKLANNTLTKKDILRNLEKFAEKITTPTSTDRSIKELFQINTHSSDLDGGDKERVYVFMTLVLAITLTLALLFIYYSFYKHSIIEIIIIIFVISQILFVPFLYGVLGKQYKYPVVSFYYKVSNDITLKKEGVILLEVNRNKLIIYDRLNFFSIDYIPEASVSNLQKLFTTSPFANCSDERFKPCELYTLQ